MKRTITWLGMIFIPILLLLASPATLNAQFVYVANGGDITVSAYRIGGTIGSLGNLEAIGSFPAGNGHPLSVAVDPLNRFVYVGDDRDSVAAYRIEPTGALRSIGISHTASQGTVNSVVVDPTGRFVYALVPGRPESTVSAFRIGPTGALTFIGKQRFDSAFDLGSVAVDPTGRFVYVANSSQTVVGETIFEEGFVFAFRIEATGALTPLGKVAREDDALRRITVEPRGRFAYATFLLPPSCGRLVAFRIEATGGLRRIGEVHYASNYDCRVSIAVDPTGQFVYIASPGNAAALIPRHVTAFRIDPTGTLTEVGSIDPGSAATAVAVDPTGRFAYVTGCAGPSCSVAAFQFNSITGALTPIGRSATGSGPVAIATTSCTAPLPTDHAPIVTTTSLESPFSTSLLLPGAVDRQPVSVTLVGSAHTVTRVTRFGACPAVTWDAHVNLLGVSSLGPVPRLFHAHGPVQAQGTLVTPGTFSFPAQFRLTPPSPVTPPITMPIQSFVTVNAQGTATAATVPPAGLVSWWKGEGDASDLLRNNPGTLQDLVSFGPGRDGLAFLFGGESVDRPSGFVEVAASASLQPAAVTAMAWVKNLGLPGPNHYVLSQGANACVAASYALYTGRGNLMFYVSDGSIFVESPDAGAGVWDGNWHLVAGTYDGTAVRLYVDGVEVGSGTPTTIPINYALPDNQRFYIGAYRGTCEHRFTGGVDEVRIFNRALTPVEIQSIFGRVHGQGIPVSNCGTTLSAPGNYVLTGDLVCPTGNGVNITGSGVHFNLAGFTIDGGGNPLAGNNSRCTDGSVGIRAGTTVSDVHIYGGTVRGFAFGIQMNSAGRSQVNGMVATRNCVFGVQLNNANNNGLAGNTVTENGSTLILPGGFFCGGVSSSCGGISLQGSRGNDIDSQDVRRNAQFGVLMDANCSGNTVRGSDSSQTGVLFGFNAVGIEDLGNSNTIQTSTSNGNTGGGIQIRGPHDVVQSNTANGNGPSGGGHCGPGGSGICIVLGPGMNLVQANTALNNSGTDLGDENAGCDADTWTSNTFGTSNQACIH